MADQPMGCKVTDNVNANAGQGSEGRNEGESKPTGATFTVAKADWEALQTKVGALETDNFKYRERLRNAHSDTNETGSTSNSGSAPADSSGEVATLRKKLVASNFTHSVTEAARKAGATVPELAHKLLDVEQHGDEDGKLKDADAAVKELKTLYPHLFKASDEPITPVDGGAGGGGGQGGGKSFSDEIRAELKKRTG